MKPHQIIQNLSPELLDKITGFLQEDERAAWQSILGSLAGIRKFRPVFIQQKDRDAQRRFVKESLKLRGADSLAEQSLQVWLMKDRQDMLSRFLDRLGVPHDGKGAADDIPDELDSAKLTEAIDDLRGAYPSEEVAVYLRIFQRQREGGWPEIDAALAKA